MAVVRHECCDLAFEIAGQVVVLKQDAVLERLMPALHLALGLRVIGALRTCYIFHLFSHSARSPQRMSAVGRQKPRSVNDGHLIEAGRRQRQIECGGDVLRFHCRAELPGFNEAREVVQHGREIVPAPSRDLEVGEVGLPELVGRVVLSLNSSAALMTM